jgi:uncharacterized DUF497 family protein
MKFGWHPTKNRSNIRKHGFDFSDAEEMFRGLFWFDPRWLRTTGSRDGTELG